MCCDSGDNIFPRVRCWCYVSAMRVLSSLGRARMRHLPLSRFDRDFRIVEPYTMMGVRRLQRLSRAIEQVAAEHVDGDIVECGVARGGSAALLAMAMQRASLRRRLWLFDSFEGMFEPSQELDPDYDRARAYVGTCKGDEEKVRSLMRRVAPDIDHRIVAGPYAESLRNPPCDKIALLHVDCDWYEPVLQVLEALYERVSPGGIVQFDDYFSWKGCRQAVDTFLSSEEVRRLERIDASGVWLKKTDRT